MSSLNTRTLRALLNALFGKTSTFGALADVPGLYLGVSSTTPTMAAANITEPSTGAYARVATSPSDWDVATDADPTVIVNVETVAMPTATADWLAGADLTHFVLFDASTSGNAVGFGLLDAAKPVLDGDTATFPPGSLAIRLGSLAAFE